MRIMCRVGVGTGAVVSGLAAIIASEPYAKYNSFTKACSSPFPNRLTQEMAEKAGKLLETMKNANSSEQMLHYWNDLTWRDQQLLDCHELFRTSDWITPIAVVATMAFTALSTYLTYLAFRKKND